MDSKLVVEQMSGRWQIKHQNLRVLARRAQDAAARLGRVRYVWVPRAQTPVPTGWRTRPWMPPLETRLAGETGGVVLVLPVFRVSLPQRSLTRRRRKSPGWAQAEGQPTTTILLRHGQTGILHRAQVSPAAPDIGAHRYRACARLRGGGPADRAGQIDAIVTLPAAAAGPAGPPRPWPRPPGRRSPPMTPWPRPTSASGRASPSARPRSTGRKRCPRGWPARIRANGGESLADCRAPGVLAALDRAAHRTPARYVAAGQPTSRRSRQ